MKLSEKGGRSVSLQISMWWDEKDDAIHVTTRDDTKFHVAVRDDAKKPSGHPYLFRELSKCLAQMGAPGPTKASADDEQNA